MTITKAAVIGGGVIGAGWVARLIENSIPVTIFDPAPDAAKKMQAVLDNAERAYAKLTMAARPKKGEIVWASSAADAVKDADLIVEAVPERLDIKHKVYAEIETAAKPDAVIASSTSGILPSDLQEGMKHPERLIVGHPFNPVYLLPVVELVAGKQTSPEFIETAKAIYEDIGMKPIVVRKEIEAFVADRLLEAVWREALWLIKDGICTTEELDDIMRFGFGLRWAQMGLFETYRIAGGEAGMRHFMAQFGPCLSWPWTKLMDVPEFNDELVDLIAGQSDAQSGHLSIRELERKRDDNLVGIMQALKQNDWGAGKVLAAYESKLFDAGARKSEEIDYSQPIRTTERHIPPDWTDYNNHMNEARYLQCFGDATDAFMRMVGVDADYIASGLSFFTVETHIRHIGEVKSMEPVYTLTQVIEGKGKRMRLFHWLYHGDGRLLATGEHMLIHVSLKTRGACEPAPQVAEKLQHIAGLHASLPEPEGLGRAVGNPDNQEASMDFALSEEQALIVETTRSFVENELYPHEAEVERSGVLELDLIRQLQAKAIEAGLYAANMPEEVGGAGLDTLTWLLYEKELGRANYALHWTCVARPSNILLAGTPEQREQYLMPCIRGEKWDCLAMTEPGAGSDLRGMKATAKKDGDDWVLNGTKHFISHADLADFAIVFMATGEEDTPRGKKKLITAFFVDKGHPGFAVRDGYRNVSHRGYTNAVLEFDDCRLPASAVLGEPHKGFEVANNWLGATRLQVAATCIGRAERAFGHAVEWAASREQFGQKIGKYQGVSFKLADMATELKASNLMLLEAGWKYDAGTVTDEDMAMAKLKATEMLAFVADEAIQIHGGMGLMEELPLERIWRDARVERIWEGTSEIQRHIISRALLRPLGA